MKSAQTKTTSNKHHVIYLSKHNTYFPTDILYIILSYLDPYNLSSISAVNHTLHSCANANHLWNPLYKKKFIVNPKDDSEAKKCYIYKTKLEKSWNKPFATIEQVTQYVDLGRHTITCLKFQRDVLSDNGCLVCGLDNNTARVMKIKGRRLKQDKVLEGHSSVIWCVDYNRKKMGEMCMTSGYDNT